AEAVDFGDAAPERIDDGGPFLAWADAVFPVVVVGEAAAGPAHVGRVDAARRLDDGPVELPPAVVAPDPEAAVDVAPEVLGEVAVDVAVDGRPRRVGVEDEAVRLVGVLCRGEARPEQQ